MTYSSVLSFSNSSLSFDLIRSSVHLSVLLGLIIHQFLFQSFVDPQLSVWAYSLCFVILLADSVSLFFHKGSKEKLLSYLLFVDALFLSLFVVVIGLPALFFILLLAFFQSFSLALFDRLFPSLLFLLYLSILMPTALLWEDKMLFDDRLSSVVFIHVTLLFIFCFGWLFHSVFGVIKESKVRPLSGDAPFTEPSNMSLSLNLARKMKPVLNSLMKDIHLDSVSQNGRLKLNQIRDFVLSFIEYGEMGSESLLKSTVDIKTLLEKLLKKLETHFQRPENLDLKTELSDELKVRGSAGHLEKCFEHVLINAFEALKNQTSPKVHIRGYVNPSSVQLEFLDNGHGMESEDVRRLFEPLFSQRFGARGLGLSYVHKVVSAHKASIHVESSQKGTKVIMKFPLDHKFYDRSPPDGKKKKAAA